MEDEKYMFDRGMTILALFWLVNVNRFVNAIPSAKSLYFPDELLWETDLKTFPSEEDTLSYVDALRKSDLSQWQSLEEVANKVSGGSCQGAESTAVLTALYLLGLLNLCHVSPMSCCTPHSTGDRKRREAENEDRHFDIEFPPNVSSLYSDQMQGVPYVSTPSGGRIPIHISTIYKIRKLWHANPSLLSSVQCPSATHAVRSSFISLSGVASGILLAYSMSQMSKCYLGSNEGKIRWSYTYRQEEASKVPSIAMNMPISGDDEASDGCRRNEVLLEDGRCIQLLSSADCPYQHWVLLNRDTMKGECVPRLCKGEKVYLGLDQLCHAIDEPGICPSDQRLYITASGVAVCDCPDGTYRSPDGKCQALYEPAFCHKEMVLQFHKPSATLACQSDPCVRVNRHLWKDDLPFVPMNDKCHQFNKKGPCSTGERVGFDTENLEPMCVSLEEVGLVQRHKSFTYNLMSLSSEESPKEIPEFEVNYILLNDTTWDLEVKDIGRLKRESHGEVSFFSTRDIPSGMTELSREFELWRKIKETERPAKRIEKVRPKKYSSKAESGGKRLQFARRSNVGDKSNDDNPKDSSRSDSISDDLNQSKLYFKTRILQQKAEKSRKTRDSSMNLRQRLKKGLVMDKIKDAIRMKSSTSHRKPQLALGKSGKSINQAKLLYKARRAREKLKNSRFKRLTKANQNLQIDEKPKKRTKIGKEMRRGKRKKKRRGRLRRKKKHPSSTKVGKAKKSIHDTKNIQRKNAITFKHKKGSHSASRLHHRVKPASKSVKKTAQEKRHHLNAMPKNAFEGKAENDKIIQAVNKKMVEKITDSQINLESAPSMVSKVQRGDTTINDGPVPQAEDAFLDQNLSDYLRYRSGKQSGGGITHVPLLTACKPGAKRDFNYKCRPKFIPQERSRRETGTNPSTLQPIPATIKCPERTKLNPRGQCKEIFSKLG